MLRPTVESKPMLDDPSSVPQFVSDPRTAGVPGRRTLARDPEVMDFMQSSFVRGSTVSEAIREGSPATGGWCGVARSILPGGVDVMQCDAGAATASMVKVHKTSCKGCTSTHWMGLSTTPFVTRGPYSTKHRTAELPASTYQQLLKRRPLLKRLARERRVTPTKPVRHRGHLLTGSSAWTINRT